MAQADAKRQSLEEQERALKTRMKTVRHKVAVMSGKGGVGKTVITVNLAVALAKHLNPGQVGILDADIHGPCVPRMLGIKGQALEVGPSGAFPVKGPLGTKVVSMDFLLPDQETPVIWRGPLKVAAIRQFMSDIVWGDLDLLLIDLPPGTGDEHLSVLQMLPYMDGVIVVTIPSEVSQGVVRKAVTFVRELGVPLIGVIENMSGFVCPNCGAKVDVFKVGGGEKISRDLGVTFLGRIPLDPKVCDYSDKGLPFVLEEPESPTTKAFMEIAEKVEEFLRKS